MSLPDPRAPRRRAARQPPPPPRGAHASEALEKLTQETREAVRGLESATGGIGGLDDEAMMEDFVKQFQEFAGAQVMIRFTFTMLARWKLEEWHGRLQILLVVVLKSNG
jgi:peroxin-19